MVIPSAPGTPKSRRGTSRKLTSRDDMSRWVRVSIIVSGLEDARGEALQTAEAHAGVLLDRRRTEVAGCRANLHPVRQTADRAQSERLAA